MSTRRAFDLVASTIWAIKPEALRQILTIADRAGDPQALATRTDPPMEQTRYITRRSGVAVIEIAGPIFRYANLFTQISGATSTEILATDIQTALDDPSISSVVLDINSPGGDATGINELADVIYAGRSKKDIYAYVGGMAASGAYWIASAARAVLVDATAVLGSIGVVATFVDTRDRDAKEGVEEIEIVSSLSPKKRPDLKTDAGRAQVQRMVDDIAGVFVAAVARNRGVSAQTVLRNFGGGDVLVGKRAIDAGMANGFGSLERTISTFENRGSGPIVADAIEAKLRAESEAAEQAPLATDTTAARAGWLRAAEKLSRRQGPK